MTGAAPGRTGTRARRRPSRARQRPARARARVGFGVRRWAVLGTMAAVTAVVCVLWFTPVFGVRAVEVSGLGELTADQVRAAAAVEPGTPLVRLDTDEVAGRVRQLPRVGTVEVRRSFPGTLEIAITERTPVAVVPGRDGAHLLDAAGVDYGVVQAAPPGLPVLDASGEPAAKAATSVLAAVPRQLAGQITAVTARTAADIRFTLADARAVRWGDAADTPRKAAVLAALLTQKGKTFDVAAPDFPTVS
ncbi:cell division protein FtsQ/DivIB [Actinokineospora enzanensis]|uniref:cell division protein FtsQ/DivIB n=1 Tax=Actinokineospora enzanensis TaxID=155975 RepID=UPI00035E96ED|nr:FtsQ-type POTRA domain-containing protein [Actinokineospora enzanensis]